MKKSLKSFFNPKGIVFVGASKNQNKLGYGLAKNLAKCDYPGEIHFVNPSGGELFGKKIEKTISDISGNIELAILLISSRFVLDTLLECKENGIKSVIIASGGFKEVGMEGALIEKKCLDFAQKYNIRLMGPNCIGLIDSHLPLNTTFLQETNIKKGSIGFISHSGAICAAILNWSQGQGFNFSKLVSLGNQADVNETDVLDYIGADRSTKTICMYLEGVADGRHFVNTGIKVTKTKPVIALKVGRSESGQKAVESHTGALAGQDIAFDAAFRRAGILRVETTEEMFNWAKTLAYCKNPNGNKVGVLTNAGGPGVTSVDAIEKNGLELSKLSDNTKSELKNSLPGSASVENPVDMLASASPEEYARSLTLLYTDPNVDLVMVILPPPPMFPAIKIIEEILPIIKLKSKKPTVVVPMGDSQIKDAVNMLRENNIPEFRFPENAASSLGALYSYSKIMRKDNSQVILKDDVYKSKVEKILKKPDIPQNDFVSDDVAHQILEAYNIPVLKMQLSKTVEDAVEIAERIGYPVALKISATKIQHKSDIGGVLLNIKTQDEVIEGFKKLIKLAKQKYPNSDIDGIHIQKMADKGQEVILGAVQDPQFGPLVMFGSGGTEIEGLEDIEFSLGPLTQEDINFMLSETWAGKKLKGFRNIPPVDRDALEDSMIRLAQLVKDFPQISEVEINPLNVFEGSKGVIAVDVRIKISE